MYYKNKRNKHDLFFKKCMESLKFAKCFYQHYLPPEILKIIDLDSLVNCRTSFIDSRLKLREADVLYKVRLLKDGKPLFLLTEHFSYYEELAGFRIMRYKLAIMGDHLQLYNKWKIQLIDKLPTSFNNLQGNNLLFTNQNNIYFVCDGEILAHPDSCDLVTATLNSRYGIEQVTKRTSLHNNRSAAKLLFSEVAKLPGMPELNSKRLPMVVAIALSHNKDGKELPLDFEQMVDSGAVPKHFLRRTAISVNLHNCSIEQLDKQQDSGFGLFALKQSLAGKFDKSQFAHIENHVLKLSSGKDFELLDTIVEYIIEIGDIVDEQEFRNLIDKLVDKVERLKAKMGTMAQHWYDEGRGSGFAEGKVKGKVEGKVEGKIEGKIEGEINKARELAQKMLDNGINKYLIEKITSLKIADLKLEES